MTADVLLLGRVAGVFGVKGWVKLYSYTEPREAILQYDECLIRRRDEWQPVNWIEGKKHGKTVIAHCNGVDDRDAAEQLVGADLGVNRDAMPPTADGEYYWVDLEGLTVVHTDGRTLGQVDHLLATGANDVLVVKGDKEILIPFVVGQTILNVDLDNRVIDVDWEWD